MMPFFMDQLQKIYDCYRTSEGVFTDTRTPKKGGLFFALTGPNFDGNAYVEKAFKKGATAAVVSDPKWANHPNCIFQENTLTSLQALAQLHRSYFKGIVIAITGSNGKTTTKELFKTILSSHGSTYATQGNYNNHIGVPLTLLEMPTDGDYYIVEMGANHKGEIAALCDIATPDWGYITNFGSAHLEGFGSKEGIIQGKTELYRHLIANEKNILFNADDTVQKAHIGSYPHSISFGTKAATFTFDYTTDSDSISIQHNNTVYKSGMYGSYNTPNIAAALAFGLQQQIPPAQLQQGLENYHPIANRSQIVKTSHNTLLMDAYNANPNSMQAAITAFATQEGKHKIVVLGDMMELGTYSVNSHQELINLLGNYSFEMVLIVGEAFAKTRNHPKNTKLFANTASCKAWLKTQQLQQKFILLKGSRSMVLETLQSVL